MQAVGGSMIDINSTLRSFWFDSIQDGLGEKWTEMEPEQRSQLNAFAQKASKVVRSSLAPEFLINEQDVDIMDVFTATISDLGNRLAEGEDVSNDMDNAITFFRGSLQAATIRNALSDGN